MYDTFGGVTVLKFLCWQRLCLQKEDPRKRYTRLLRSLQEPNSLNSPQLPLNLVPSCIHCAVLLDETNPEGPIRPAIQN